MDNLISVVPEWFLELMPYLSEGEIKLIGVIIRAGREECSEAGGQSCTTLKARLQNLADDAGIAPRSAISASQSLEADGALTVYPSSHPHGEHKYVLYTTIPRRLVERIKENRRAKFARRGKLNEKCKICTPLEKESIKEKDTPVDVVDKYLSTDISTPTRVVKGSHANFARLLDRAKSLGVVGAEKLTSGYPPERILAALDYVTDPLAKNIRSQAGYFIYLLTADFEVPDPLSKKKVETEAPEWTGTVSDEAMGIWRQALEKLNGSVSPANFKTWLVDTVGLSYEGEKFIIGVPHQFSLDWLSKRLSSLVRRTLIDIVGEDLDVEYYIFTGELNKKETKGAVLGIFSPKRK